MSESIEESAGIPNINMDSSKSNDVYEINFNVILIILGVVILGVVGFFIFKSNSSQKGIVSPTPTQVVTLAPTSTPTSTPSPTLAKNETPAPTAKQKVKIQVLNGTGITGDAAYLRSKLTADGFFAANVTTDNAASPSEEAAAQVTYYPDFPSTLKIDFTSLLNTLYANVTSINASESGSKYDAVVTTGKKK